MSKVRSKVDQLGDSHTYLFRRLHAVSRVKESFARILRSCCHFPFYDLPGRETDDGDILDARRPAGTGRPPSAGPALEDMAQDQMVAGRSARRRPMSLSPLRCSSRARTKHRSTTSSRTTRTARSSSLLPLRGRWTAARAVRQPERQPVRAGEAGALAAQISVRLSVRLFSGRISRKKSRTEKMYNHFRCLWRPLQDSNLRPTA